MTVISGFSTELGTVAPVGKAPGAGLEAAFDQLLATLDIGAAAPVMPEAGAPMPVIVRPVPTPGVIAEIGAEADAAQAVEGEPAEGLNDADSAEVMTQPFVAPPVVIAMIGSNSPLPAAPVRAQPVESEQAKAPAAPVGTAVATPTAAMPAAVIAGAAAIAVPAIGGDGAQTVAAPVIGGDRAQTVAAPMSDPDTPARLPADLLKALGLALPREKGTVQAPRPEIAVRPAEAAPQQQLVAAVTKGVEPAMDRLQPVPVAQAAIPSAMTTTPGQPLPAEAPAPDTALRLGEHGIRTRIDIANETALIDRLARDIAQLSGGEGRLKFQLNPEHLGSLHVEVAQGSDGVSLRFGTETEGARAVLAEAQHRLVNEARAQGMRIAETHIDLHSQNQGGSRGGQPSQPFQPIITSGEPSDAAEPARPAGAGRAERFA